MPSEPMSRTTAAVTIQHFARSRVLSSGQSVSQSARNMWLNITNKEALEKLRALYLDERAIRAGARESALYTDEMLARREALRSHELVHRALENLWVSIPRVAASQLSKDEYMTLARKLYLINMMVEQRMGNELDPNEWRADAELDFKSDAHGKSFLTKDEFFAAWFECADVHTIEVTAAVYAGWLDNKAQQMTRPFAGPAPNPSLPSLLNVDQEKLNVEEKLNVDQEKLNVEEKLNVRAWRSDGDIIAHAYGARANAPMGEVAEAVGGIRALPLSRAKRLGGQRSLYTSAGSSLTHSPTHSPSGSFRKKMPEQSHHRHSVDAFPGARILSLAPLRKPRRHSLNDLPSTMRVGVLPDVGARYGAHQRWFDAVKEEELREGEAVKQLARGAVDELSRRKKRAMPQLGGSLIGSTRAPDMPFTVSRSRSSSSFTASNHLCWGRATPQHEIEPPSGSPSRPPSGPSSEAPSMPSTPLAGGLPPPRRVADPRLHPWEAPVGPPAQWLLNHGPSSPTNGVRADSIKMAKQRAKEAHDDFMLSNTRATELATQALNMRSPMHRPRLRPRRRSLDAVPLRRQTDANGRLCEERDDR